MNNPGEPWWNAALTDFGRGLGFDKLIDSGAEVHNFLIGDKYLLDIECADNELVLAVFCELPGRGDEEKIMSLLRQCNFDKYLPFPVQVGLKDDDKLALAVHLDKMEAHQLGDAFDVICRLYADAGL